MNKCRRLQSTFVEVGLLTLLRAPSEQMWAGLGSGIPITKCSYSKKGKYTTMQVQVLYYLKLIFKMLQATQRPVCVQNRL